MIWAVCSSTYIPHHMLLKKYCKQPSSTHLKLRLDSCTALQRWGRLRGLALAPPQMQGAPLDLQLDGCVAHGAGGLPALPVQPQRGSQMGVSSLVGWYQFTTSTPFVLARHMGLVALLLCRRSQTSLCMTAGQRSEGLSCQPGDHDDQRSDIFTVGADGGPKCCAPSKLQGGFRV